MQEVRKLRRKIAYREVFELLDTIFYFYISILTSLKLLFIIQILNYIKILDRFYEIFPKFPDSLVDMTMRKHCTAAA